MQENTKLSPFNSDRCYHCWSTTNICL